MENIWFTSDHHFGHKNIIRFCERPFESVEAMNEELIKRWNERVQPNDRVYHLGDVALCSSEKLESILDRLNGKIFLIKGNHEGTAQSRPHRFEWIKDYFELSIKDETIPSRKQKIILCHYAMRTWNGGHRGTFQLYGHSHGTLPDDPNLLAIDVGVDCHDFYPISYEEVKAIMSQKTWTPPFG